MAVDICSPRISFSYDLKEPHLLPIQHHNQQPDALLLDSIDFDFSIDHTFTQDHLSSADELFKNGKILPFELKKTTPLPKKEELNHQTEQNSRHFEKIPDEITQKQSLKELLSLTPDEDQDQEEEEKKQPSLLHTKIPFWQFRRSTSLNLESCRNSSLIRSLNFLSRSNSTGSVRNPKPSGVVPKVIKKQNSEKERRIKRTSSNQYYSFSGYNRSNSSSRKNYGNGVRISPILNILPQGCISRGSVSLFGLSSFFCNSKSKKKKSH